MPALWSRLRNQTAIGGKFLFIDPVGQTVNDFVELAVFRHLHLCIAKEQLNKEEVVAPGKGNDVSIGREKRNLLRTAF